MTKNTKISKRLLLASRKPVRKAHKPHDPNKERIRNYEIRPPTVQEVKNKVDRLVKICNLGAKVKTYESVAVKLSTLACLNNGHVWSWNYVASAHVGAIMPGLKFIRALDLCLEQISPREKRWFYFVHRHYVASVYDKAVRAEIIRQHMREMNYREVTYTRYMEVKRRRS